MSLHKLFQTQEYVRKFIQTILIISAAVQHIPWLSPMFTLSDEIINIERLLFYSVDLQRWVLG